MKLEHPNWQETKHTVRSRLDHILKTSINTDITFIVQNESFECHKLILSIASCELEEVFYGLNKKSNSQIIIHDISIEAFKNFLNFVYTDELILNHGIVTDMLNLSDRFKMNYLKDRVTDFLTNNLNYSSLCQSFEIAHLFDFEKLKLRCEEMLQLDILSGLSSKTIKRIDQKTLEIILKADLISCREYELFCSVMSGWATEKCLEKNIPANGKNLREQLGDSFKLFLFHTMTSDEFINCMKSYNEIMEPMEAMEILMFINTGSKIVDKFEKKNRSKTEVLLLKEKLKLCNRFVKISFDFSADNEVVISDTSESKIKTEEIKLVTTESPKKFNLTMTNLKLNLKVSEKIILSGVGLMKKAGYTGLKFEMNDRLTFLVTKIENKEILKTEILSKTYIKEFQEEDFCVHSFLLEKPLLLEKDVDYCIELKITFLQFYLKMLCKNEIELDNVKFTFNSDNSHIGHILFKGPIP